MSSSVAQQEFDTFLRAEDEDLSGPLCVGLEIAGLQWRKGRFDPTKLIAA